MKAPYTTDTLYAGVQLIQPGQTATPHGHVVFALRLIFSRSRGLTTVVGQNKYGAELKRSDVDAPS